MNPFDEIHQERLAMVEGTYAGRDTAFCDAARATILWAFGSESKTCTCGNHTQAEKDTTSP